MIDLKSRLLRTATQAKESFTVRCVFDFLFTLFHRIAAFIFSALGLIFSIFGSLKRYKFVNYCH